MFTMLRNILNLHCQTLSSQSYFYYLKSPALSRISKKICRICYKLFLHSALARHALKESYLGFMFFFANKKNPIYFLRRETRISKERHYPACSDRHSEDNAQLFLN